MKDKKEFDISKRYEIGIQRGVSKALQRHKLLGQPIVIYKDSKIVKFPPEEIVVPHCPSDEELL